MPHPLFPISGSLSSSTIEAITMADETSLELSNDTLTISASIEEGSLKFGEELFLLRMIQLMVVFLLKILS